MWYLIQRGRVIDKAENNFPVHPSLEWVEDAGEHEPYRCSYAEGVFTRDQCQETPFVPDPRDEALDLLLNAVNLDAEDQEKVTRLREAVSDMVGR